MKQSNSDCSLTTLSFLPVASLFVSGCATKLRVTTTPAGSSVLIKNSRGNVLACGMDPVQVKVSSSNGGMGHLAHRASLTALPGVEFSAQSAS